MYHRTAITVVLMLGILFAAHPRETHAGGTPGTQEEEARYRAREAMSIELETFEGGTGVGAGSGQGALALASLLLYSVTYPIYKTGVLVVDAISDLVSGSPASSSPASSR
jgi:hypothetical protein